ncbi:TonB-dependent receptor family protein [Mucilaginibacter sp. Bleaf8]|uniref:outer membrane beta-barrel family protein n=1 Tax=Mucilaginibacter sp. Bleaf8 TaxID=2834430 RepID=UPI001BCEC573|nr:outer membrane beta-barrel family protein [Mucilaginibacter sp. Bleaf8]MBS7566749.1 TonB-dependent receptor family protein [Mucilaginibacter sp. Bleaf8]
MKYIILLLCVFLPATLLAQSRYGVSGMIKDSTTNQTLENATIAVLTAKDSILQSFTRAKADGSFNMNALKRGKYILLVSYPDYADYAENFELDSVKSSKAFGRINMILKSKLLQEVIVKAEKAAIKIKGDTTEFNASSFKIQPNAKVEDLLKQLPGIQVDKDGKITAQGQAVNKVLVDGEEFFGDDPTLVTKNLRADMVDKVQLYDKKSDQAAFTGIDDDKKAKTINIKLKDDKKQGYFGKVDGGIGTDKYYQTQAMFNAFKAKQKLSVYGTLANTGKTGLGWQDSQKYGSSSGNVEMMDGGGVAFYFGGGGDELESFDGRYNGEGIPTAKTAGVHYDTKWNKDKESLNTNYKIGDISITGVKNVLSQNNLPTGTINSNNNQSFDKSMFRQKLDATYQLKIDTSSNLKVIVDATTRSGKVTDSYDATSVRGNDVLLNESTRDITNNTDGKVFHANVFWNRKFKKKSRTISFTADEAYNENNARGFLNSKINFYDSTGRFDRRQVIDQLKTEKVKSNVLKTNLAYTEPLAKNFTVVVNYGFSVNNSTSDRRSYNASGNGYTALDSLLSNNYEFNQLYNEGGAIFNYKGKKGTLNFGTRAATVNYKQIDEFTDKAFKRSFVNWNPQASYNYKFAAQTNLRVAYQGNTMQPTINQLQPVFNNTDPLNITIGNPNLKPSFRNEFNLNYNSYRVLTEQYVGLYGSYSFTSNPIVSNATVDSAGRSTYQSVNFNKNATNFYFGMYSGRKVKSLGSINIGLNLSANGNTAYNLINNAINYTKSYNYSGSLNVSKYKEKKYDLELSAGPNYTVSESSLQKLNNNGYGFNSSGGFNIYLPLKFQIGSDGDYQYRAKTESFNQSFERFTWNARISKTFTKQDQLKISLAGYDLLNQNKGFDRSAYGNTLTQTTYTNIRRYFMLSLTWDFSKMGGSTQAKK